MVDKLIKPALRPYQQAGIDWLQATPRALLGDEPGTGKTRQLLEAADGRVLVVAPAYAQSVWADEWQKWRPSLDLSFVSYSSLCERKRIRHDDGKMGVRVENIPKSEFAQGWDIVILDEAHNIKNRKAKQTDAVFDLQTEWRWLATGTPIPNWAHELWTSLRLLKPDDSFLNSYWRWVEHWFRITKPRFGVKIGGLKHCSKRCKKESTCEHWAAFHSENLGRQFLQRLRDDVLSDLPPLTEQVIRVPMTPVQRRVYNELKRDYRALDGRISAWSNAGLITKLRKVAVGVELEVPGVRASGKLKALQQTIRDYPLPAVVFVWHRATAVAATEALRATGLSVAVRMGGQSRKVQDEAVERHRRGQVDVLVASLATSSEALNLQHATTAHRLERSFRPSTNVQAARRLHRFGQTRPVHVIDYVTEGTYEIQLERLLARKTDQQVRALTAGRVADLL